MLRDLILLLAIGPLVFYALVIGFAFAYFQRGKREPVAQSGYTPAASILKPVRGLDCEAYENFASFCTQAYPAYEVLFCVNGPDDPAVPIIKKIQRDFPECDVRLLLGAPPIGASGKVNKLCRLVQEAKYDLLVISDSDVRVKPNYLCDVAAPLADPKVGAITVFFRSLISGGLGGTLDAAGSAVEFAASALLARKLEGIHFTLGATMATTKRILSEIGGFEALANHYVDDYELGRRIAGKGYRVELAATPVSMVYPCESLRQFFRHELRWTIGLRNVRPGGHAALAFTFGLPWTMLAMLVAPSSALAGAYAFAYLALRSVVYLTVGIWGLQDPVVRKNWWLVPLRDAINFCVWVASFFSSQICWRGLNFRVSKGLLIPLENSAQESAPFSIEPNSVGAMRDGKLGVEMQERIELRERLVDSPSRQAELAASLAGKSAGTGDD